MKPTCKIFFWLALGVFTALTACKKDEPTLETSVEGYVQDATTGKGIENMKVYLTESNGHGWFGGPCGPDLDSLMTPANGYYTFHFTAQNLYDYCVIPDDWGTKYWPIQGVQVTVGEKNTINLSMYPNGYIRVNVKNIPPANDSDTIAIGGHWDEGGGHMTILERM